jgi:chorismate mutase
MTMFWQNIGISLVIVIGGIGTATAQSATVKLERLVETSARRLTLARQVAFAKWDARSQIEDTAREGVVITAAVKAGQSRGLDRDFVSNFFKAQIEANKLVQYSLLASWHRAGSAPFHPAINLTSVRARLDRLQEDLINELADTAALRTGTACQADTATAVGKYVAIHKLEDPLVAMALDRAMAATCIPSLRADSSNEQWRSSPSADKIEKIFLPIAQDLRICLVCGSLFTMRGAAEHCDTMIATQFWYCTMSKDVSIPRSLVLLTTPKEKDS